jgi:hypothetical protein
MARLLLMLFVCGCPAPRSRCNPNAPSQVELRDGKGVLLMAARTGEKGAADLCDGSSQRLATVTFEGATATLLDRGGAPRLHLRRMGPDDVEGSTADNQPRLRVHRDGKSLYFLDPIGVRLGSAVAGDDKTVFYDKQQVPAGSIEPRGPDQAVRDPEGSTLYLVQPGASSQLAGTFTIAGLDRAEQTALYLFLSR